MIERLQKNFLGKICTILTNSVSFPFRDAMQHSQFFTGKVESIDEYGIWLRHLNSDTIAFYTFPIVGIVEEQVVSQQDPRAEQIKEEIKKQNDKKAEVKKPIPRPNQQFIPLESLTKMIKK